jgi:excisionase family DNA binding protein
LLLKVLLIMRIDKPLLVSIAEASFQLSLSKEEIRVLIRDGELVAVKVRDQVLVVYDSLKAFTRRARLSSTVADVARVKGT